jgi:phosphotransferase system  glucose/maltose/N-acetylglucosamine-specific IIC component
MLSRYAACCLIAALSVWLVEHFGMAIAHSSGGLVLASLLCPGMLPGFLGLFENQYIAWVVAVLLTATYYFVLWKYLRKIWQ